MGDRVGDGISVSRTSWDEGIPENPGEVASGGENSRLAGQMGEASSAVQAGAAGVTGEVKTTAAQKFLDTLKSALTWLREKVFSPILRTLAEALKNALRDAAAVTGGVRELGIAVGRRVSGAISQGIGGSVGAMGGPDRGSATSTISDIPLVPADPAPVRDL